MTASGAMLTDVAWPGDAFEVRAPRVGQAFQLEWTHQSRGFLRDLPPEIAAAPSTRPRVSNLPDTSSIAAEFPTTSSRSFSTVAPTDVMPGDRLWVGESGEHLGILAGGVVSIKASEFAAITLSRYTGALRLVGNRLSLLSGAGRMEFGADEEGRTGMALDLGSNAAFESDPARENYRFRQRILSDGQTYRTAITRPDGSDQWSREVDEDGAVFEVAEAFLLDARAEAELRATGPLRLSGRGTSLTSAGAMELTSSGAMELRALSGLDILAPAGSMRTQVGGRLSMTAGAGAELHARGGTIPLPTNRALSFRAVDGSVVFDIGNPAHGDQLLANSGFEVNTQLGSMRFGSKAGSFEVNTLLPGSVKLGGAPGLGIAGVVMYEAMELWFNYFGLLLDTHTHNASGVPTTPPLIPIWSTASPLFHLLRSRYVSVGG